MKKGFTLVELIAVIVLLSLIALFTFPSVNKTIKDRKEALYNVQIDNIKASAVSYIDKNGLLKDNDKVIVTLCQLKQNGFTDEKIKNPINNKYIPDDSKVIVTKDERIFIYGTDGNTTCTVNDTTLFEYVEVGSEYKETIDVSLYTVTIYSGDTVVNKIDTSKLGSYFIEYVSSNKKINKYVYIVDTTGPSILYKDKVNGSNEIGKSVITIEANQGIFIPYNVIVSDNSGEVIEPIISSNVNLRIPGSYYITYKASDSSGNTTIKTQAIKVVDTKPPVIESVSGNPSVKTPMSVVITVNAYDNGVGLHPLGAYSFDGGKTWQVSNSITVDSNTTLNIVVRDAALNQTKHTEKITNILKDDKNISFTVKSGTLKNNGWFTSDVDVLVKPLVSNDYFESFSYCTGNNICTPDKTSTNYNGETIKLTENTSGTLICGRVNKKDKTKTDVVCSTLFKIDKSIPDVRYEVISGKQNNGYEPWYVSDVNLAVKTSSISGIEKIEYCTTTGNSCTPNKTAYGSNINVILSTNSKTNKVCSIVTNNAGTRGQNTCSISYQIDKTTPSVSLVLNGGVGDYIGKTASIKAVVSPSTNVSGYTYIWYKNGTQVQSGTSDTITISNGDNIYKEDTYRVVVITGAGNKGESSKKVKVDTVKPTCSLTANGTNGNNGWFISSSVNVIGTFKDNESGVESKGVGTSYGYNGNTSYSVSTNTKGTTIYCSVKDKVGNEGSNSITIKKDDGSDSSCSLSGENSSWTNGRVHIKYLLTNSFSGIAEVQDSMGNAMSTYGDDLVDQGQIRQSSNSYGLEAIFYNPVVYKTMSFSSWSITLNSGAKASCPAKTANVYYDAVKPTCSFAGNTPNGSNGWYKSNADIKATFSDGSGSGVDRYGVGSENNSSLDAGSYNNHTTYALTENTNGKTLYCIVKDKAGNVGTNSITVKKDDGVGSGNCYLSGENTTWTNVKPNTRYVATSSGSGFNCNFPGDPLNASACSEGMFFKPAFFGATANADVVKTRDFSSFSIPLNSGAKLTCPAKTANIYYDNEKPTCSISISGTMGNNGWYKTKSTASVSGNDGSGSGVASALIGYTASNAVLPSITINEGGSASQLVGIVKDKAGNTTTCTHGEWKVDATIPSVKVTATVASGTWTNKDVTLYGGVTPDGVDSVFSGYTYRWTRDGTYVGSTKNITATSSGTYTLTVTTGAGNSASASYNVKIDKTAPTCDYSGGSSSWTNSYVTIKIGCEDKESGCASGEKSETIKTLTRTRAMTTTIKDKAGNSTTCTKTFDVYYDGTDPVCSVNITSSGTSGVSGNVSATDTGSGISGSSSKSFTNIKSNKTYTFSDKAGNSTSCTVNVTSSTEYRKTTCKEYKACSSNQCDWNTCLTTSCSGGWDNRVWGNNYKCCSSRGCGASSCHESNPDSRYCIKDGNAKCLVNSGKWNSCKYEECVPGYETCRAENCGCETWNSAGNWSSTSCKESTVIKCESRTVYYGS